MDRPRLVTEAYKTRLAAEGVDVEKYLRQVNKTYDLFPAFGETIRCLVNICWFEGLGVGVFCGLRTYSEQTDLYRKGRDSEWRIIKPGEVVTNAAPGFSWHNFGLAADIVFFDENQNWSWADKYEWKKLGRIGEGLGLTWGGKWKSFGPRGDFAHFQNTYNVKMIEARRAYKAGGLTSVFKRIQL